LPAIAFPTTVCSACSAAAEETYPGWTILNHESWVPETFTTLGTIGSERLTELTGGLMRDVSVDVRINRHVAEADVAIVVGPVFPHEVVGFSGGNKYFFPWVSGQELIDLVALGRRLDHERKDDRDARRYPGTRSHQ
jgi:nickel-dependent lactate racemase